MAALRLRRVVGYEARCNDVVYHPPTLVADAPSTVVFFAGDVQDYPEVMQAHRDNKNFLRWNLENTARTLGRLFRSHHVMVVRPARIEYKSFSCYDNFVPSNNAGVPDHTPTHNALRHLERLLQGVSNRLKAMPPADLIEVMTLSTLPEDIDIEELHNASLHRPVVDANGSTVNDAVCPEQSSSDANKPVEPLWWLGSIGGECKLTLLGFSKGCVVLNQMLYEFHYTHTLTPGDEHMMRFISRISAMYWLDGGHAGGKNTWITARSLLETLARLDMEIFVHVSPYQVQDSGRPWIGREEKAFTNTLKKLGARIRRYNHTAGPRPYSLHTHFAVLANFAAIQEQDTRSEETNSDAE